MSKKAFIIGSGGFAKEVLMLLDRVESFKDYTFSGFIDVNAGDVQCRGNNYPSFAEDAFISEYQGNDEVILFIGLGDPKKIAFIAKKYEGFSFPNLVSPDVYIDHSVEMGQGNIVTAGVKMTADISIGSFNIFNLNMTVGHDVVIGNYNVFNPLASISGEVKIGNSNLIGLCAAVLQGLCIGDKNIIGGNGLLTKSVEDEKVMVGVPCKDLMKK